ncbi:MAG: hypothetical protein HGB19_10605 [Chlorobiales bacterium]|nr:hypothetical protein [Chlorobiales bacterium]
MMKIIQGRYMYRPYERQERHGCFGYAQHDRFMRKDVDYQGEWQFAPTKGKNGGGCVGM